MLSRVVANLPCHLVVPNADVIRVTESLSAQVARKAPPSLQPTRKPSSSGTLLRWDESAASQWHTEVAVHFTGRQRHEGS
jgi:hypothetical protein